VLHAANGCRSLHGITAFYMCCLSVTHVSHVDLLLLDCVHLALFLAAAALTTAHTLEQLDKLVALVEEALPVSFVTKSP
jgi:hypothetical protein